MSKNKTVSPLAKCRICSSDTHELRDDHFKVTYDICPTCGFLCKQAAFHPSYEAEEMRYLEHNNDDDIRYKAYMERFIENHVAPLGVLDTILDYGSGPYPMLAKVLEEKGYLVSIYDPFFAADKGYQSMSYQAIILQEVIEHIQDPMKALREVVSLLETGGYLIIQTQFRTMPEADIMNWWYRRDLTHISFFNQLTFEYIAQTLGLTIHKSNHKDVIIFTK